MLKKFLIGTVVALALLVGVTASAADFGTTTLKVGSKGPAVIAVQTVVGATTDGSFGPMTKAAVMAWQANHGLVADGLVGPATKAAMNTNATVNCPVGQYDPLTGQPCGTVSTTLPAGCASTVGYSPTTGAKCDGGSTSNGPLVGGAGDINLSSTSTDVQDSVTEGAEDTKILGFKVEASGSDVSLTNLKISLQNTSTGTASYRLNNVASEVAVWMNGTKVGSALVSDFSKDTDSSFTNYSGTNVYSKSISLNNAIVREGSSNKQTFYVTITALSNIDSTDMNADNWLVYVNNIRFQDATGVVMTSSDTAGSKTTGSFQFETLANSGDVKVIVSKGSGSPTTQQVAVSTTGSTKDQLMLEFKVKTTGSTASFDSLNVTTALVTTGATDTYTKVVGQLILKDSSGNELATIDGSVLANGSNAFTLDDTYTVPANTTQTFRVYADINDADANFTTGAKLSVSFLSFSPEDSNGGIIGDTGSATGDVQTLVYNVATIGLVGTPTLALFSAAHDAIAATYKATIDFNITAPDDASIFVPLDSYPYLTAGNAGVLWNQSGSATVTSAAVQYAGSDNLTSITDGASYRVDAGTTQKFELTVYLTGNSANNKISMTGLWYETALTSTHATNDANATTGIDGSVLVTGLTNLYTPLVYLSSGL